MSAPRLSRYSAAATQLYISAGVSERAFSVRQRT